MPTLTAPVQSDLQCPTCAGQCAFSPETGLLTCSSCGHGRAIAVDPDADPAAEFHYHPDLPHTEQSVHMDDQVHQCETCGGEVIFVGATLSERCAYCDGPMVLSNETSAYAALGMIPFAQTQKAAQSRVMDWVTSRRAAPNDLSQIVGQGRVAGIYVPFWTFDSDEAIEYMVKYRVKSGKNWVTRTLHGAMNTRFDDLLAPASPHVTPLIRDGILHDFDPTELHPYTPSYVAGFAAERHHQSVKEGLEANAPDKDLLIRNRIRKHAGKSRIKYVGYKTDTTGLKYRRILLPVWILHYSYKGKPMKVVSCGLHGRTFGERPFSSAKLFGYSAALSATAILVGWLWGAMGML